MVAQTGQFVFSSPIGDEIFKLEFVNFSKQVIIFVNFSKKDKN